MSGPIYKMARARLKEAFFALSKAEQDALGENVMAALASVGGKQTLLCDSAWSSEEWWFFAIEEFPSIEAVQEHSRLLTELNWKRYTESETLLGTAFQA